MECKVLDMLFHCFEENRLVVQAVLLVCFDLGIVFSGVSSTE